MTEFSVLGGIVKWLRSLSPIQIGFGPEFKKLGLWCIKHSNHILNDLTFCPPNEKKLSLNISAEIKHLQPVPFSQHKLWFFLNLWPFHLCLTCLLLSSAAFLSVSACSAWSRAFSLSSLSINIFFLTASILVSESRAQGTRNRKWQCSRWGLVV